MIGGLLFTIIIILYLWRTFRLSRWKNYNVPHVSPHPLWGNFKDVIYMRKTPYQVYGEIYRQFPQDPYVGIYILNRPGLLLRDPQLIKDVVQANFASFLDNDLLVNEKIDPIFAKNPFTSNGENWKKRRIIHTRQFTSGKIKYMFELVKQGGDRMTKFLDDEITRNGKYTIEAMELAAKYTIYNIGSCTLGIDARTFDEDNSEMRDMGRKIIEPTFFTGLKQFFVFILPNLSHFLSVPIVPLEVTNQFRRLTREQLRYRKEHGIVRNDFFEAIQEYKGEKFSVDEMMVQIGGFFIDAFATNSSVLNFILFELATNPDVQEKLREEIDQYLLEHDGNIINDSLQKLSYLNAVFLEGLRKYPALPTLTRLCTKTFTFPPVTGGSKPLIVKPNTPVVIPLIALHYDEKYFPDSQRFDPKRFLGANKDKIEKFTYMPFGEGPRLCLGNRFASIQSKIMLFKLLSQFEIGLNPKTIVPIRYSVKSALLAAEGGIWINLYRRQR